MEIHSSTLKLHGPREHHDNSFLHLRQALFTCQLPPRGNTCLASVLQETAEGLSKEGVVTSRSQPLRLIAVVCLFFDGQSSCPEPFPTRHAYEGCFPTD